MSATPEKELISRLKKGDEKAFRELYDKYYLRMVKVINGIVRDEDAAYDLVQEAFTRAYEFLPRYQEKSSIYTWLTAIALNVARNFQRKTSKVVPINTEVMHEWVSESDQPEKAFAHQETLSDLDQALQRISYKDREILVLYYYENMSVKDIAEAVDRPEGTVKSDLYYARKNLKDEMAGRTEVQDFGS